MTFIEVVLGATGLILLTAVCGIFAICAGLAWLMCKAFDKAGK